MILPGLDGTGRLLAPFLALRPAEPRPVVVAYPADRALGYGELLVHVQRALPRDEPFVLLAESFSGPLAIDLAALAPAGLRGLVLCASFARGPRPLGAGVLRLAAPLLFRLRPPRAVVRALLVGADADEALVASVTDALATVAPAVLARRLRAVLRVDSRAALSALRVPLLCLVAGADRLVGASAAAEIATLRPEATIARIDGPHLLLETRPREVLAHVERFLAGLAAGAGSRGPRR